MKITFHGAAHEVTGSLHVLDVNGQRILLDCGMFQGHRADIYARNLNFGFDPAGVHTLVLSHAHIDHSGDIPNLVKQGFRGNIWSTAATRNLCAYMLMDSAHIQESDAQYLNQKQSQAAAEAGAPPPATPPIAPLYTQADAQASLEQFVSLNRHRPTLIADGVTLTFYEGGHILGSTHVALDIADRETGKNTRLVFSGDIGRPDIPIVCSPERPQTADLLIMESTYGDRLHPAYADARNELAAIVQDTVRRRGKLIIPAFAVGRTQEIVYALHQLAAAGAIPPVPIFVDSPLAVNVTEVFRLHPEEWDEEVRTFLTTDHVANPFDWETIEYVREAQRSKQLNGMAGPAIIISANGMAESGRILHHLKNNIEGPNNTILFVGYQAENTLGRRLLDGARQVHIFGEERQVRAQVKSIEGYSAHADQRELLDWAADLDRSRLQHVFVVHGEGEAAATLAGMLQGSGVRQVTVPERDQAFEF